MSLDVNLSGIMNAMVIPMKADGSADLAKLAPLVEFQITNGVHSLLATGGTGEYPALTMEDREAVVKEVVRLAAGRVPVVAGVLDPGIGEALKAAHMSVKAGADALLVLPPYYTGPTQQGIYNYFKRLDEELNVPLLIYNNPGRTCTDVLPETIQKMVEEIPGVVGVKECTPYAQSLDTIRRVGDKAFVLSGADLISANQIAAGAKGGVLATSCIVPQATVKMYEYASTGHLREALEIISQYFFLFKLVFAGHHPAPLKYAMSLAGHDVGEWGLPLVAPDAAVRNAIKAEMARLGLLA